LSTIPEAEQGSSRNSARGDLEYTPGLLQYCVGEGGERRQGTSRRTEGCAARDAERSRMVRWQRRMQWKIGQHVSRFFHSRLRHLTAGSSWNSHSRRIQRKGRSSYAVFSTRPPHLFLIPSPHPKGDEVPLRVRWISCRPGTVALPARQGLQLPECVPRRPPAPPSGGSATERRPRAPDSGRRRVWVRVPWVSRWHGSHLGTGGWGVHTSGSGGGGMCWAGVCMHDVLC